MKTIRRNILWAGCLLIAVAGISGCATRTRLGDLIPAHHLSDQRKGEEVWVDIKPPPPPPGEKAVPLAALGAQLAAAGVGAFIDYVKAQMQSEAARYDADFHNVAFSDTVSIFGNNQKASPEVLLTRWVDGSPPKDPNYDTVLGKVKDIVLNAAASSHYLSPKDENEFNKQTKGKTLAFAYCVKLFHSPVGLVNSKGQPIMKDEEGIDIPASPPFRVQPEWKWQWLSKAKIVSFHTYNPLSWPAGLFLKTGSSVEYEVDLMLSALIMTTNGYPQTVTIGLKDPIQANAKFDLSGKKQFEDYTVSGKDVLTTGWIAIPGYPTLIAPGYFGIGLAVKESDPSNVKTMLLQGSEYLQNNKQSIINRVTGGL